jgi:uncharacterized protein HemX
VSVAVALTGSGSEATDASSSSSSSDSIPGGSFPTTSAPRNTAPASTNTASSSSGSEGKSSGSGTNWEAIGAVVGVVGILTAVGIAWWTDRRNKWLRNLVAQRQHQQQEPVRYDVQMQER